MESKFLKIISLFLWERVGGGPEYCLLTPLIPTLLPKGRRKKTDY